MINNNLQPGSFIVVGYNTKKLVFDFIADKLSHSVIKLINHPDCKVIDDCDIIEIDTIREATYFLNLTPSLCGRIATKAKVKKVTKKKVLKKKVVKSKKPVKKVVKKAAKKKTVKKK